MNGSNASKEHDCGWVMVAGQWPSYLVSVRLADDGYAVIAKGPGVPPTTIAIRETFAEALMVGRDIVDRQLPFGRALLTQMHLR